MIDTSAGTTTNPSAARTAAVLADLGPCCPNYRTSIVTCTGIRNCPGTSGVPRRSWPVG